MGLFKTAAKVAVASSVHGRVQQRQQSRWANQQAASASVPPVAAAPAPAGAAFDQKLAQLKQLGELRDSGILSADEFEIKKAQILNS